MSIENFLYIARTHFYINQQGIIILPYFDKRIAKHCNGKSVGNPDTEHIVDGDGQTSNEAVQNGSNKLGSDGLHVALPNI